MNLRRPRFWNVLAALAVLTALGVGYQIGYQAGLSDQGPDHRALIVVTRPKGSTNPTGYSATWFDLRNPKEAAKLREEEEELQAQGVDHYVAKGVIEKTMKPEPDPRRVNSHR